MSDITLEWFFQIPGLFITIGVLLILIALLVLIIGSSKAKNKKQEDLSLIDDVQEAVANQVDPVNVLETNNINYLNGANNLNNVNNFNQVNNSNNNLENNGFANNTNSINSVDPVMVNESVTATVEVGDNIAPVVNNSSNIVTPLNVSESIVTPVANFANVENIEKVNDDVNVGLQQVEPIIPAMAQPLGMENSVSNDSLTIQEPVLGPVEVGFNDTPVVSINESTNLVQNTNSEIKPEVTMAPIFAEPITPVENVVVPPIQEEVQINEVVSEPLGSESVINVDNNVSGMVPPIVEPVISNLSPVGTDFVEPMEPVKQKDLMVDNSTMVTPVISDVNNTVNPTQTVESSEVEEIL